jgi:hypothetical protein
MRKIIYIDNDIPELTTGKIYEVLDERRVEKFPNHQLLIENDNREKVWYFDFGGIIKFAEAYDVYVKYIGEKTEGLTPGNVYQTCGRKDREHYYFLDDNNKYCGVYKINYFGGAKLFEEIDRIEKIDMVLKES